MKISTILDHIDSGHMALPEFQRGYVWNRDQVRGLFDSLYRRHPVGGLLVWATESKTATHRGDGALAAGVVKLLLDGQQRMTSLYGVVRGRAPKFFDGNAQVFTGLRFHLETETFEFYQPVKMKGDPLWTDVTGLMQKGNAGLGEFVTRLTEQPALAPKVGDYVGRLARLLGIVEVDLHVEEVTGADKSLDVVVNIFNRVNSGGTKLSKGDLALAKIVVTDGFSMAGSSSASKSACRSNIDRHTLNQTMSPLAPRENSVLAWRSSRGPMTSTSGGFALRARWPSRRSPRSTLSAMRRWPCSDLSNRRNIAAISTSVIIDSTSVSITWRKCSTRAVIAASTPATASHSTFNRRCIRADPRDPDPHRRQQHSVQSPRGHRGRRTGTAQKRVRRARNSRTGWRTTR